MSSSRYLAIPTDQKYTHEQELELEEPPPPSYESGILRIVTGLANSCTLGTIWIGCGVLGVLALIGAAWARGKVGGPRIAPKTIASYGTWDSPIVPRLLGDDTLTFSNVIVDRQTGATYWSEGRRHEAGREVIVSSVYGDVTPVDSSTRSRVNTYGGGAAAAGHGRLWLSDFDTNGLVEVRSDGSEPRRILGDNEALFYGDFDVHPTDPDLLLAVQQDETDPRPAHVVNSIVLIDVSNARVTTLVDGTNDFYLAPRWNHDGSKIAWIEWSQPYTSWDGSLLKVADFRGDWVTNKKLIAGRLNTGLKPNGISVTQPRWALDGETLLFLSDVSGYIKLHAWSPEEGERAVMSPAPQQDLGGPDRMLAQSTFTPLTPDSVLVSLGHFDLAVVNLETGSARTLEHPTKAMFSYVHAVSPHEVVAIARPLLEPAMVVSFDPTAKRLGFGVLKEAWELDVDRKYLSTPQQISFPTRDPGSSKSVTGHAYYYPPGWNPKHLAPTDNKPPLIVYAHPGPNSFASPALDLSFQMYTSRGFALLDVDAGGSVGWGKRYMDRLVGQYGVLNVDDCVAAVQHLVEEGLVDGSRVAIIGHGEGGYTVLQALINYPDVFAAAVSSAGIADLVELTEHSSKFDYEHNDYLLGGSHKDIPNVWRDRSPLLHADKIKTPLLLLHGQDDAVVPVNQSIQLSHAVRQAGTRCELREYAGEAHVFGRAGTLVDAAQRSLDFILDVLDSRG